MRKIVLGLATALTIFGLTLTRAPQAQACWYILPDIWSVSPKVALPGELVTIYGGVFQPTDLAVYYGSGKQGWTKLDPATVWLAGENYIYFLAPGTVITDSAVYVHTCGGSSTAPSPFSVKFPIASRIW